VVDDAQSKQEDIVTAVVEPLLDNVASVSTSLPSTDSDVFQLNSLYQIHTTLALFQFNDSRLSSLEAEMQLHLDTLASEQTSSLIANLGLQPVCTMLAEHSNKDDGSPLAKVPGMEEPALREFLAKFDGFLAAPDVFLLPQTRLLTSSSHRR